MNIQVDVTGVVLQTKRITLRPFEERDLDDFYEYASVPGVGEMAGWPHHKSIEDSKFILDMFMREKKTFAIVYEGKTIGSIGIEEYNEKFLPELKDLKAREIGYVLSKDYWGLGIMPEAVGEVIRYCFEDLNMDCLVCGHFSFNQQSARVQEKLGFMNFKQEEKHYNELWGKEDQGMYTLLFKEIDVELEFFKNLK